MTEIQIARVKSLVSLKKVLSGKSFKLPINYGRKLTELIPDEGFTHKSYFLDDNFIEGLEEKESKKKSIMVKTVKFVSYDRSFFAGEFLRNVEVGYRPATWKETMFLLKTFPEILESFSLVAFGSCQKGLSPCIRRDHGGLKYLYLHEAKGLWMPGVGILIVKK